jgi:phosphatidylserine/phosphatidylglycerophosphate/cardiolipin synthase-like enzyme
MIADPSDPCSDPLVLTGSHNWSNAANTINDENTLIIHDDTVANLYYQAFRGDFYSLGGTMSLVSGCHLQVPEVTSPVDFYVYPNPANGAFTLNMGLAKAQQVRVELLSVDGRSVHVLTNEWMQAGNMARTFSLSVPGIYVLKVISGNEVRTLRVISQ